MKKSLLALAALSAIAGTAQAQSSVTLFGAIDAGAYAANRVQQRTTALPNSPAWGVLGNTIVSSNWGIKGTEDLGGGLKANFYAESGINPRNGALGQANNEVGVSSAGTPIVTLFDRGLYVGVEGTKWGRLDLGNKLNPFFATHGGMLPVSGNSVGTNAAGNQGYQLAFVHNSLTYTLPTISGLNAALQYGAGNQVNDSSSGSVFAAGADYTVGGLNVRAGYQYLASKGTPLSANNIGTSATLLSPAIQTYLVGAKYNVGAFTLGGGWVSNNTNYGAIAGGSAANPTRNLNNFQVGVGYQATPALLVGLSWIGNTVGSNLVNAQARYAFSKRTQAYAQLGLAANGGGFGGAAVSGAATGAAGSGVGNMTALFGSSGSNIGNGSTFTNVNYTQFAGGVGLIHTF